MRAPFLPRRGALGAALALPLLLSSPPRAARAFVGKTFVDPAGRFALTIPPKYAVLKRMATTGTIYVAGDFPRSSIVSVTAWPLAKLVESDAAAQALPGLPPSPPRPAGPSLADIGSPAAVAEMLIRERDREASQVGRSQLRGTPELTPSEVLRFSLETNLPVADPDALEKERGVRELVRRTVARSEVGEVVDADGARRLAVISVWGSSLVQDWGADLGPALQECVNSFSWQPTGS